MGSWLIRSCWSSPTHATWPSGRSSAAGTSSSSLTSTTWSTRSSQPPPKAGRSGRAAVRGRRASARRGDPASAPRPAAAA
ncbi:hypothetical protein J2853_002360 [Streptosporangium lutulentum]|uniref:Uncharacterized protein n=1 Tax=Streptosporangium lutulentum TaxID=1461250 RepID=A0ABT9Q8U6_9ACTN|nr:hypothetical protein [Streptosporangium lutulentum]